MDEAIRKAGVLIEALGWIRRFRGKYVVIKLGGSALEEEQAVCNFLTDVIFLETVGMKPILVHGGGKAITKAMNESGIKPRFVHGRRYTDDATLEIVARTLAEEICGSLVAEIQRQGGKAAGLSFATENVLIAEKLTSLDVQPEPSGQRSAFSGQQTGGSGDSTSPSPPQDAVSAYPSHRGGEGRGEGAISNAPLPEATHVKESENRSGRGGTSINQQPSTINSATTHHLPLTTHHLPLTTHPIDLGHVGHIVDINRELLDRVLNSETIPVLPSVGMTRDGRKLNVNADTAAAAVARLLPAEKLVFLSDVPGIFRDRSDPATLISHLDASSCRALIADGTIDAGMIPKVEAALEALQAGVGKVHLVDARMPHSVLLEIYSNVGVGTEIVR